MQDKKACEHACAVRAQAPAVATINACSELVGAIGRKHADDLQTQKDEYFKAGYAMGVRDGMLLERAACSDICERVDEEQGGSIGAYFCGAAIRDRAIDKATGSAA